VGIEQGPPDGFQWHQFSRVETHEEIIRIRRRSTSIPTAAASFWSSQHPRKVTGVKDLLGHADFATTQRHYIMAQSRLAGRVFARAIESRNWRALANFCSTPCLGSPARRRRRLSNTSAPCAHSRTHPSPAYPRWIGSSIYPDLICGRDSPRLTSSSSLRRKR